MNGVASTSTEQVLLGRATGGSCSERPDVADCIPSDRDHIGADIVLRDDGTMFVSTGDGGGPEEQLRRAQDVDSLAGKILRVDRSGRGLPDNPFWDGNPGSNRSKVWALGFRNPFRLSLLPGGHLLAGDVGLDDFEEIDRVTRGGNYGWPCLEGPRWTPKFDARTYCRAYYASRAARAHGPWLALPHDTWGSVVAGTPLAAATLLPEVLRTKYAFGDWATSTLWVDSMPGGRRLESSVGSTPVMVGDGLAGPVRLRVGADGALYCLSLNVGELRRITAA